MSCFQQLIVEALCIDNQGENFPLSRSKNQIFAIMGFRDRFTSSYNSFTSNLRSNYLWDFTNRREDEESEDEFDGGATPNKVESIQFYIKENAKQHHTKAFDLIHDKNPKPMYRRGQTVHMAIRFKERDFNLDTDKIVLNFRFGNKPLVNKGTMGVIRIANKTFKKSNDEWDAMIDDSSKGRDLVLQVKIPATVPVGRWQLHVNSKLQGNDENKGAVFKEKTPMFILFNPWCKEDPVYMDDDEKREEYVLNDQGKVFVGTYRTVHGRPWAFGQFDDVVIPVASYILDLSKCPPGERGNPVKVVRAITAGVNSNNDGGILEGRWDGEYKDGVAPFKWTGSVRILETYMESDFNSVKYGQCWVFSALVTTICRALGIPCRSVTNFVSAHDTDASLTIDTFFDKHNNEVVDEDHNDSIWNFHVWNDVWMARSDLPSGYGGWQAIDSTPQELSENVMQCGPASLVAIHRGDIGLAYDATFVFSEVNSDIMHWKEDPSSDWGYSNMKMNKFHIGRSIMTKKPGVDDDYGDKDGENVVNEYKDPEGTTAERLAIHNAISGGSRRAHLYHEVGTNIKEDVKFDLIDIDKINIGDPFKIKVTFRNTSKEKRTIMAALHAKSIYYTGVHHSIIKKAGGKITIGPREEKDIQLVVQYKEYWKKLQEQCMIKIYAVCSVEETKQTWTDEDDFQVLKPKLQIKAPAKTRKTDTCSVDFTFTNPLDDELTNGELSIDGAGLMRPRKIKIPYDVNPNEKFSYTFKFRPRIHGNRKIIASFNSTELFEIMGTKKIEVLK